ncbi:type I restriction-modification system endonuclease [uncultured Kordia sp.]|uniref:type I restriction-modification system endonuclease n=1 Tax=uncultured Kordia sp. TaxID=507699 RepID=UPI00261FB54E|nr:type I restriction-modification system endonuclease [uncultured Kordia sp.]
MTKNVSPFSFLNDEYKTLLKTITLAEKLIYIDPSSSLIKSRLFTDTLIKLIYEFEALTDFDVSHIERIKKLKYNGLLPDVINDLLHTIRKSRNNVTHKGESSFREAHFILKKCFLLAKWFYETYENTYLGNINYILPEKEQNIKVTSLESQLEKLQNEVKDYKTKIAALHCSPKVKKERVARAVRNAKNFHLNEKETRILFIDSQLRKAGWEVDTEQLNYKTHKTLPKKGKNMAIAEWYCDGKWADYALFIGTSLYGIVEAKKYATDISADLRQSVMYATKVKESEQCKLLGDWDKYRVPFIFSSNGRPYLEQIKTKSGIWFLDVRSRTNIAKALQGWISPKGLEELYDRDITKANETLNLDDYEYLQQTNGLGLRYYQIEAIKAIEDKVIHQINESKALLVMATGTGKTRTVIGLAYRFIKSNRFKRILFLTDRNLLASQALGNFNDNRIESLLSFGDVYKFENTNIIFPDDETRLHFATVQSMVKRIFHNEEHVLTVDTYDCIIVDEAHRGYTLDRELDEEELTFKNEQEYQSQYRKVIDYFNAYCIGLTATPALHTSEIFGAPTYQYSYRQAVIDGYLVDHEPPYNIKTKLSEEGIIWQEGEKPKIYNPDTNTIEELAVLEDELKIEIEQFNKLVITKSFNKTVAKYLVDEINPYGDEKTLIFATRDDHADMIVRALTEAYNAIGVEIQQGMIEKITGKAHNPKELTTLYKNEQFPNIAVTVDLLTTGIDVPRITNLVFLRRVRSRILFEQMLGRATRLCDEIGKEVFRIYDAVRVYEALSDYTQMKTVANPKATFTQLSEEFSRIKEEARFIQQVQQIIVKLQRKRHTLDVEELENFEYYTEGQALDDFIIYLKSITAYELPNTIPNYQKLWNFLDKLKAKPKKRLLSEHTDELLGVTRGYGKAEAPEDYIESFKKFILENRNKIAALKIICTKPKSLNREALKELRLLLSEEGFSATQLNTAWKNAKNEDIAADIISYIRTMALDVTLINHQERVRNAIQKIKANHSFNKIQLDWLHRFQLQLEKEYILQKEDLNKEPFKSDGGYVRLNKIFKNQLDVIIEELNTNLYSDIA